MSFTAGAAETIITPPVGARLEGYGGPDGGQISTAVHDDLHARAVVFDDGTTRAAMVACDLIAIDRRLSAPVRALVHDATGIPPEHLMVSATHTHQGPQGIGAHRDSVPRETMARRIADAVIAADAAMRPCVLKVGQGLVDSVSQNRRHPDGPRDDTLNVLLFDAPDPRDGPIASIVNFACHATVMYRTNTEISADYPGYASATVKKVLGDAPALFLQGACGDVNPSWIEQRFDEAERVGSIVGAEAARRLQELRPLGVQHKTWNIRWDELTDKPSPGMLISEPRIRVASRIVDAQMRVLDDASAYAAELADLTAQRDALAAGDVESRRGLTERITYLAGTRGMAAALRPGERHALHPEVQAIAFSPDCAILGLPGEFFAQTAHAIRRDAGIAHLSIACYTNHHVFYVVPEDAWPEGGYEPGVAVLDETAEASFRSAATELLREVTT
jgi:neutral/alkaline ceramidase-like enzyme